MCIYIFFFFENFSSLVDLSLIIFTDILLSSLKVTKKSDLSDFYFNLGKNVAFGGGKAAGLEKTMKQETGAPIGNTPEMEGHPAAESPNSAGDASSSQAEISDPSQSNLGSPDEKSVPAESSQQEGVGAEQQLADQMVHVRHKRSDDALAAAKERYLARKRAKEQ